MKISVTLVRAAAVLALIGTPLVGFAAAANADAPTNTGSWNFATRDGLPQPPSPPGVNDGDLLVQAGDPSGSTSGTPNSNAAPTAVAALRFTIPAGSSVGPLSFEVASGATAMDVRAYPTTDRWKPVQNGPLTDAPTPDRSRYSLGVLTGSTLIFSDIRRLIAETGTLSVVVLPGATDRVVLLKPGINTLTISPGQASTPTPTDAATPPPVSANNGAGGVADPGAGGAGMAFEPTLPNGGEVLAPSMAGPAAVPPVAIAPPVSAQSGGATQPVVARGPLAAIDDTRTRYFAAAEAALVLITFGLFGWGPFARLASLVGAGQQAPPGSGPPVRGVGRFSRPREGVVVRL